MIKTICTYISLLLCIMLNAQNNQRFANYSVNEGLPQSSIYDIIQDRDNFMWIGTAGGLTRFDGYQFKVYKQSASDPKAIPGYKEFRFYNDRSGKLWVLSFNGISVYNSLTDDFTNILVYQPKNVVIAENHFYGEDDDFIWIGLCNYGIVKVHKKTLKAYPTTLTRTSSRPSNNVAYHGFLEKGKLWIVDSNESDNSVFSIYDIQSKKSDTIPLQLNNIISINDSEALGLTIKTAVLINKKTLATRNIFINDAEHRVVHMYQKSATEVILSSTAYGLFYIDTRNAQAAKNISYTDPENTNPHLFARCVYTDRSGNTWIGTAGEGVYKKSFPFKNFKSFHSKLTGNNNVFGVFADEKYLYAGGLSQGLNIFSKTIDSARNIKLNAHLPQMLNNAPTIRQLSPDKLLIISNNSKNNGHDIPFTYTKSTGKIEPLPNEVQKIFADNWGRGNLRHFLFTDPDGNYITNVGENVVSLQICNNNAYCPKIIARFPGETLTCGFTDRDGKCWIGSFSGVFWQGKNGWERVNLPRNKEIKSISQDPDGNIWMGSNDEIFVLNKEHKTIQNFTEENELLNAHVYGIIKDDLGNMWFSHNKGLTVYHWKEKKFEHFDKSDGLQSTEYNIGAYFKAWDGQLFFGGIEGVTAFYPEEILHNPNTPVPKITGIKVFDEPYQTDTAYWNIHRIVLPYTENSISFEFALPEFTDPLKNTYQFRMTGVDDKWINAGDRRFARYAGLRPGTYVFKVRGANNDGRFGEETSVVIIIVPPFWQQTWFIILMVIAFILLSVGLGISIQKIRQRKAIRALEFQHKLQLERERISRDLHDNVGTQLSLISKNIEGVINPLQQVSDEERIRNLGNISQTSKEVIFTLRETIWALNKEEISLEELSDKLKAFTQKLFEINNTCRLLFTEDIGNEEVILSPSEAIHLFRICQEAITNSLKYANATVMDIRIQAKNGKYVIMIGDDGIGFEKDLKKTSTHYGLDNMKYRAQEIGCKFAIDTTPGGGTRVSISKN
jgi:signal transduction histidine kinase/ligand-binding sensor domain-containing protein